MQQTQNLGQVDSRGGFSSHKHFRAKGSSFCSEIVCKSLSNGKCSCEAQNRQHTCSSLHQSSGVNKVCGSVQSSSGALEVVSASSDNSLSRASPRNSQPGYRPSFTHFQRSHRVDDKSTSPQRSIIITSSKPINRPVCFSSEQTVSNLLQLETRSRRMEDRCLQFPMDTEGPLCFLTICLVGKVLAKVIQDKSQNLVLVTPWWPCQPWFPLLKGLAITQPRFLKETKRTLVLPHSEDLHP